MVEVTYQEAPVLVAVFRREDRELRVVLVRCAKGGIYGSQLALPGGKHELVDASLLDTALRESWEELGLPPERIQVLAALPGGLVVVL